MRELGSITHSMDMNLRKLWGLVEDRGAWHAVVPGVANNKYDLVTQQQQQILVQSHLLSLWSFCSSDPVS